MIDYIASIYNYLAAVALTIGILFFLYFCFISFYTKNPISFALIWPLGSTLCFIFSFTSYYIAKNNITIPITVVLLFLLLCSIGAVIFGICELFILKRMFAFPKKQVNYLIILGAGLRKDRLTKSLQSRLDTAYNYLIKYPKTIAIVSGGMGAGEIITEAEAMNHYLIQRGIAAERILQEKHSANTYENILYSKELLPNLEIPIGIVTNNFHIYRAEQIAKKQNLTHAEGLAAPSNIVLLLHFMVREGFAVLTYKLKGKS